MVLLVLVLALVLMLPDIFAVHSSRFTTCIEHAMGSHVQTHAVHIFKQCTAPPRKKHILNNRQFFHLNCYHIDRIFLFFSLIIEASNFSSAPIYGAIFIVYSVLQLVFLVHLIHSCLMFTVFFFMKDSFFN